MERVSLMSAAGGMRGRPIVQIVTVPITFTFFRGLLAFLGGRGFQVTCVSAPGRELAALPGQENVAVWPLTMSRRISPLADCQAVVKLTRFLLRQKIAVVHAHTPKAGLVGVLSGVLAGTPVIFYHVHGFPFVTARGLKRCLLIAVDWLACALADRVFAVGLGVREEAAEQGIYPLSRIRVIGAGSFSGVDATTRFDPALISAETRLQVRRSLAIPAGVPVVGFVGRIVRDKGVVELARAWERLSTLFPELHLVIVGERETGDPVPREILEPLMGHPRVHGVGQVEDVRPYYAIMDAVMLPTYREGLPYVPLEAAAMGVPVIASDVRGCRDAVKHAESGWLVAVHDHAGLVAACSAYLRDPELRARHGRKGRQRILDEFAPQQIWTTLAEEYEDALARCDGVVI